MYRSLIRGFCTAAPKKQSLVILGTGWGGFKLLQDIDATKYDVKVISPRNHFVYTPLLAGTAVGTLEFRCISEPIRAFKKPYSYYEAFADDIDFKTKTIKCRSAVEKKRQALENFEVSYDKLVIACGAVTNTFNTPGVQEHAYFLKEIKHARMIRNRILDLYEMASQPNLPEEEIRALLHFGIVGGGPTGIELSAEIHDFIIGDVTRLYPHLKGYTVITVYDVADKILSNFDARLAEYATKKFARDGTEIKTGTKIKEVKDDRIVLADGSEIRCGMVVWATGLDSNPLIKSLPVPKDKAKRLITDGFLHVLQDNREPMKDVYGLGDCAGIENYHLPQTAQVATQKAKYLANVLSKDISGKNLHPFIYHDKGALAYLGDWRGLFDSNSPYKGSGYMAWLIWRSAYLNMIVSVKNKILIPAYWFMTWAFGRDTSRF